MKAEEASVRAEPKYLIAGMRFSVFFLATVANEEAPCPSVSLDHQVTRRRDLLPIYVGHAA